MRCLICKEKFKYDAGRCQHIPKNVCEKCALSGKSVHQCDSTCFPTWPIKIDSRPLSSSVIGSNPTGEIKGVEEDFFPSIFNFIYCDVKDVQIVLKELHLLHVSVDFSLRGNKALLEQAYQNESWKYQHVADYKKESEISEGRIAHLFATHLWSGLRLIDDSVQLTIDSKKASVIVNPNVDFLGLPDSYPPDKKAQNPQNHFYTFFIGKFTVFYGPFVLEKNYHIEYDIEAINFVYETGYLFPFKYVDFRSVNLGGEYPFAAGNPVFQRIDPFRTKLLPPAARLRWFRDVGDTEYPPQMYLYAADPFRDTPIKGEQYEPKTFLNNTPYFNLKDFTLVRTGFMPAQVKKDDLYLRVRITKSPLPIRVFDQLQKLPRYRDFLIEYDLINFSHEPVDVEITSEISGITDQIVSNFTIPAMKNSEGKPARIVESQCPNIKFGILDQITEPLEATLSYQINIKGKNGSETTFRKATQKIKILPHDVIVWSIKDKAGNTVYDLSKMIGSWVTPIDREGLLDEIRGKAKNYHPAKILVGNQGGPLEDINSQVKALYDYLNAESGISYVEQSTFKHTFDANAQRVLLPERVIKAHTGNCIDLTVLFASLLEGLGINPLILLTSDHAFLGWGNKYSKEDMGYLECTMLGRVNEGTGSKFTFEEAFLAGKKEFADKFILKGANEYIPIHSIMFGKDGAQIIDIGEVRKEGIKRYN